MSKHRAKKETVRKLYSSFNLKILHTKIIMNKIGDFFHNSARK